MAKTTVRVTMFADPIEVDEDEVGSLRSQGLLIEDEPSAPLEDGKPADGAQDGQPGVAEEVAGRHGRHPAADSGSPVE